MRRYRRIGRFVAVLNVQAGSSIRFERTTSSVGHFTLWGAPEDLLAGVQSVILFDQ
jgi:hypothetical protein